MQAVALSYFFSALNKTIGLATNPSFESADRDEFDHLFELALACLRADVGQHDGSGGAGGTVL